MPPEPVESWGPFVADAFISYAREDHGAAARLAAVFEAAGWDVWWDREILAGQSFDEVIERELSAAKVVIVLWSEHSVTSSWVRTEANDALDRGVLIPALLAPVTLPLAFRRAQTADLATWDGRSDHAGLEGLLIAMEAKLGPRRRSDAPSATAEPTRAAGTPAHPVQSTGASASVPGQAPTPTSEPPVRSTGGGTRPPSGTGDGRSGVAPQGSPAGTGGGGATGIVDRLWGNPASRRRMLIGGSGAVAVVALLVIVFALGGGGPASGTLTVGTERLEISTQSGEIASNVVQLSNDGDAPLADLNWSVSGQLFSISNSSCPLTMDVGVLCELTITLDATESAVPASVSEQLRIGSASDSAVVALIGEITGTRAFTVEPTSLVIAEAVVGDSSEITVTNTGDVPLTLTAKGADGAFSLDGACGGDRTLADPIAVGNWCLVAVSVRSDTFGRAGDVASELVFSAPGLTDQRVVLSAHATTGDAARIRGIELSGPTYSVSFETFGYQPTLPGEHVHFFFDSVLPDQAGVPGNGPWYVYGGGSPFTGYGPGDRPARANALCILVANPDHTVQARTGNCVDLP